MSNEGHWAGEEADRRWSLEDSGDGYGLGCEAALPGLQWLTPQDIPAPGAHAEPAP